MDVTSIAAVTDVKTVNPVNTENLSTPVNEKEILEQPDVDFTAGPFVTRRNPTAEISSMISSLYISDSDQSDDDDEGSCILSGEVVQIMQADITQVKVDLLALNQKVQNMEHDFKRSIDSTVNRETNFRQAVDTSLAGLEDYFLKSLEKLERAVTDCFLRREAKWESQMKKLRLTSTPTLSRLRAYSPASSHISLVYCPQTPRPVNAKEKGPTHPAQNITYNITPPVHTHPHNVLTSSVMAGSSSFCARPPIRLEFPSFGDSSETAEVLNFIEQCENFLEIRPLPSVELIGTLSTVLKGPV